MARKTTSTASTPDDDNDERRGRAASQSKLHAATAARLAADQVTELTGRDPIGIVGVETHDDGWRIEIEVVEAARIPSSADMLATYSAELDAQGTLTSCRRASRYLRGSGYSDGGRS